MVTKKRVWALYRVSTRGQVNTDDDIPMQKNACKAFIQSNRDWQLDRELYERGISGWKNTTDKRDELLTIKKAAENNHFDILLVFMFDRIGRRDDESPLVVQFLIENGVEVWSVKEGQAKLEDHNDKLFNYLRFWQSSGESLKTSIRVKEVLQQLNEQGYYTGGNIPYGYELYETDVPHPKKDKMLKRLRRNPEETAVHYEMFSLVLNKGYGASRIAQYFNERGILNRGKVWRHNTISRILRNPIAIGLKRYDYSKKDDYRKINKMGDWKTQPKDETLIVVNENDFLKVQEILDSRRTNNRSSTTVPVKSRLLLAGIAKCGYCGCNLKSDWSEKKYVRKTDGKVTKNKQYRYSCHNAKNTPHPKRHYGAKLYEKQFEEYVIDFMSNLDFSQFKNEADKFKHKHIDEKQDKINGIEREVNKKQIQLDKLNDEVAKSLMGESKFTPEQLSGAISKTENDIEELKGSIKIIEKDMSSSLAKMSDIEEFKKDNENWIDRYKQADIDAKKMMISKLVKNVIFKDGELQIDFHYTVEKSMITSDNFKVVK